MSTSISLIGRIAVRSIEEDIKNPDPDAGFAKLVMYQLPAEDMLGIVREVGRNRSLAEKIEIALPRHHFPETSEFPGEYFTHEPISELRNKRCLKTARLMALVDDSQAQSLAKVGKISRDRLLRRELSFTWVEEASRISGVSLPDDVMRLLSSAISGLFATDRASLRNCSEYLLETLNQINVLGPKSALGLSMWCLRAPSSRETFLTLKNDRPSEFQKAFNKQFKHDCYLVKRSPNQTPFTRQALSTMFAQSSDKLLEPVRKAVETFIAAGDGWNAASTALAKLEWSEVRKFFEDAPKSRSITLGDKTEEIFKQLDASRFDPSDWKYIEDLKVRGKNPQRSDPDTPFYLRKIREIQEDPILASMWERFIFGGETKCNDFRVGLLECAHRLRKEASTIGKEVYLEVIGVESEKLKLRRKNPGACLYFEKRYGGLQHSLASVVSFRKCEVFEFSKMEPSDKVPSGKKANQLAFRVRLVSRKDSELFSQEMRLVWEFQAQSVLNGYASDLDRLLKYAAFQGNGPFPASVVDFHSRNSRIGQRAFSLADASAIQPPTRTELGAVVPSKKTSHSLKKDWKQAIEANVAKSFLSPDVAKELDAKFSVFAELYQSALTQLNSGNITSGKLDQQAVEWSNLLSYISDRVTAEAAQSQLIRPLLRIGLALIHDEEATHSVTIVCPWHPLRLQSLRAIELRFKGCMRSLIEDLTLTYSDQVGDLFLKDAIHDLETPGVPEVGMVWRATEGVLVSLTDSLADYSVMEQTFVENTTVASTSESPIKIARQIGEIVQSYLQLQPHERDNFSIVLYNCDSKLLPPAVVDAISDVEDETPAETTCQIFLTHDKRQVLASLYENMASQEGSDDAFFSSEVSRDFMSRVRINISVDPNIPTDAQNAHPTDVVFCHNLIASKADPSNEPVNRATATRIAVDLRTHHWSRKRQLIAGENSSVVYLTCPAQTEQGWRYLYALTSFKDRDHAKRVWMDGGCLVPSRKLNFDKAETVQIFRDTHALGNWVVNFDEMLDRRILRHREIQVIRYRQSEVGGKNMVISSTAKDTLLRATLVQKLGPLLPLEMTEQQRLEVVARFIAQANDISGNLVLRAARRAANANELIGLVLSQQLVRSEFPVGQNVLTFLLDDYAEWLGQTEERIADLLMIVPHDGPDGKRLDIVVTEAKFVRFDQARPHAKESQRQLRDSLELLEAALQKEPGCADQDLWLAKISDLLLEGIQNLDQNIDIVGWREAIRTRNFKLCLRGQSHVFLHGSSEYENDGGEFTGIKGCSGEQEIFCRRDVRKIVQSTWDAAAVEEVKRLRLAQSGRGAVERRYSPIPTPQRGTLKIGQDEDKKDGPEDNGTVASAKPKPSGPQVGRSAPKSDAVSAKVEPVAPQPKPAQSVNEDIDELSWVTQTTEKVRHALLKRELSAEVMLAKGTPNALLLQLKGSDRLTVDLLEKFRSELRTTNGLDIINIRPGLGSVVLMIARPKRKTLTLEEAWRGWAPTGKTGNTDIRIALREVDNEPVVLSIYPQPHTLVAGTTGSGKSVLIQTIILGIAATNTPEQAEIIVLDPKQGVDYFAFDKLPHLSREIVVEPEEALTTLSSLVDEMERRYKLFRESRVQNIDEYLESGLGVLPRIWLIHDEFGDWMQDKEYRTEVTPLVNKLGQKSRAAGIYMIFAAQRPDDTIFPMILRSNLPNRLVLKVDSDKTSEIAAPGKIGAERLLGRGHLIAVLLGNYPEPQFAQVPFISAKELMARVEALNEKYPR